MAISFLVPWFRRAYRLLLYTYPTDFRRRYSREMEQVFGDRCRSVAQTQGVRGLLRLGVHTGADWLTTAIREWSGPGDATQITGLAGPAFDGVPAFFICDDSWPSRGALMHGAVLSFVSFMAVTFLLAHSGDRRIIRLFGSHHPSRSLLLPVQASGVPSTDLKTEIKVKAYPGESPVSGYFKLILVLGALDTDGDNVLSTAEIAHAPEALGKLDRNRDGKLTAEECGAGNRARLAFMRIHPVLAALDSDGDGEISGTEIKGAPATLITLDKNRNGQLTEEELRPSPRALWPPTAP